MSKRGENIYKRKDGRREGRYLKSNSKYGYIYGKSYKETKEKLNSAKVNTENNNNETKVAVLCDNWLAYKEQYIKESSFVKYKNIFKKHLKKCSVPDIKFHALRHTFTTRCIEAEFEPKALSEILGHSSVNTTLGIYTHPSLEYKRENINRLTHF